MGRIFITGDTHGSIDIRRLNIRNFPQQSELSKDDYVIVCGDFGLVWDSSREDHWWRNWLSNKNFTTLFVDGNHENFDLLEQYPETTWNGGKARFISDSIIHLMRGQVYTINGLKFFTMGGAESIDKAGRTEGVSWWRQEMPSNREFETALDNLDIHNWSVDYVITHTTSTKVLKKLTSYLDITAINKFFDLLDEKLEFKQWYFGHFHDDIKLGRYTLVYDSIIEIQDGH